MPYSNELVSLKKLRLLFRFTNFRCRAAFRQSLALIENFQDFKMLEKYSIITLTPQFTLVKQYQAELSVFLSPFESSTQNSAECVAQITSVRCHAEVQGSNPVGPVHSFPSRCSPGKFQFILSWCHLLSYRTSLNTGLV